MLPPPPNIMKTKPWRNVDDCVNVTVMILMTTMVTVVVTVVVTVM